MSHPPDDQYVDLMRTILRSDPLHAIPANPTRLLDHVYVGSQSDAENLGQLRSLGVTHVLNCAGYAGPRPSPDASPYGGLGIEYLEFQVG